MKFLKGLALTLLSFFLLLSLSIFSLAFLLNSTVLNADFITSELDRLEVSSLVEEAISEQMPAEEFPEELSAALVNTITKLEPVVKEQVNAAIYSTYDYLLGKRENPELAQTLRNTFLSSDFVVSLMDELDIASLAEEIISEQMPAEEFPEELRAALVNTITKLEPQIKEQASAAADPIFAYLLGKSQSLDLAQTLRNTFLSSEFVASLVDELDIASLAGEFLSEQLTEPISGAIPEELDFLVEAAGDTLAEALSDTLTELEPWLKEQLIANADPILDYLLGESQSLSIAIPLEPVMEILEDTAKEAFLESAPPLLQSTLEQLLDELFGEFAEMLPATFVIDESLIGTELPAEFAATIAEAEESLAQARQDIAASIAEAEQGLEQGREYVSYFQLGYNLLIVFMLLLIIGIVLIHRQVKGATRGLGITFLTFGAIELIGIFVAKYFAELQLAQLPPMPTILQAWLPQFLNNFLAPLQVLSIGLVAGGIALIVASFVYPRWRQPMS